MADRNQGSRPGLSTAEVAALAEMRPRVAAHAAAGQDVADALRSDFPEFDDITLGRLALRFAAYLQVADKTSRGYTVADMTKVLSAAAIELTALETGLQAPADFPDWPGGQGGGEMSRTDEFGEPADEAFTRSLNIVAELLGRPAAVDKPGIRREDGTVNGSQYTEAVKEAIAAGSCPWDGSKLLGRRCTHLVHGANAVVWDANGNASIVPR